jgi:hypothetical protein
MGERSEEGKEKEGQEAEEGDRDCCFRSGCTDVVEASVKALADCASPATNQFGRSEGD